MTIDAANRALANFKSALESRDRASVNKAAVELIDLAPRLGTSWRSIATVLERNGEHGQSFRALANWAAESGGAPAVLYEQAGFHARAGRHDESERLLQRIPKDRFDPAGLAYLRGTIATNAGRMDDAVESLREAVTLNPASGHSWLALSMVNGIDDAFADRMMDAEEAATQRGGEEAATYYYAVARLMHRHERYDDAFRTFERGAAIVAALRPYDRAAQEATASRAISGWSSDSIRRFNGQASNAAGRQIFVTGLPRSGTTLTEQILAANSRVQGGAELSLLRLLHQDVGGLTSADLDRYLTGGGSIDGLRDLYRHLLDERAPGDALVVDKTLALGSSIGLLAAVFPDAPIVWLRRDPADCAWSIFSTYFLRGMNWAWSLGDIAHFFTIEDRLFAHWTEVLKDRVLVVPYEGLASQPEEWVPRISRHAGLEMEERQLTPHLEERVVSTASVSQVREPINRKGIDSSAPYRDKMQPFFDGYGGQAG
ncbi:sulfotransferase [Sphingomonas rhizophila]|uniref:Sulfotransferase n=1 Tax=Sphingomonas rhizophila TaxID=2071607 RepID=A0A7G9SA12_9SPHN|nr:sulfotransferase [Sphingomonas rhizophila]QNN64687.1 sulfotransferase [Sphingomonas rhizophila]